MFGNLPHAPSANFHHDTLTFLGQFDLICFPTEAPKNNHKMHVATERLFHQPIGF